DVPRIVGEHRNLGLAREPRQPGDLLHPHDLVRHQHVGDAARDQRLGLAHLLRAHADRARRDLPLRDLGALVALRVRAQSRRALLHHLRHACDVALERVQVDDERRRVDLFEGDSEARGGDARHGAAILAKCDNRASFQSNSTEGQRMAIPNSMRAVEITQPGGPEVLKIGTHPLTQGRPGVELTKVAAAGVNRPDTMQRAGNYPVPAGASDIPGLELAGGVVAVGEGVKDLRVGDSVTALVAGGGYAEYCTAPVPQCLPIPKGMSPVEAASLPETFFTVWSNVFDRGRLAPGESFLVQGGSSGIGVTAIQMVKAFGNKVYATA